MLKSAGLRFYKAKMNYSKPAISFEEQLNRLKQRGLIVENDKRAIQSLSTISFYRFRAYTYPFQDNTNPNHPFTTKISFDEIMQLYDFDRKLRILVFDAIERIEISLRTQIIYRWAIAYGSHWQLEQSLYKDKTKFIKHLASLQKEINRSNETFIKHYKKNYTVPSEPPSWMSLEVSSFGLLSLIYKNLKNCQEKKEVAKFYGLRDVNLLESWMHNFSNIRNICAHHGRLWNRRIAIGIMLPKSPIYEFVQNKNIYPYKLYSSLCAMVYIINIINPDSFFKNKLKDLINTFPRNQEKSMGFPKGWQEEDFWK